MAEFVAACEADGVWARLVPTDYAGHSVQIERIQDDLLRGLAPIAPVPGDVAMFSTVTGDVVDGADLDAAYWYRNMREMVRFEETVRTLVARGFTAFVECSAHPVLTGAVQETLHEARRHRRGHGVAAAERRRTRPVPDLAGRGPRRWGRGRLGAGVRRRRGGWTCPRTRSSTRLLAGRAGGAGRRGGLGLAIAGHPLLGAAVALPEDGGVVLTGRLSLRSHPWLADHAAPGRCCCPVRHWWSWRSTPVTGSAAASGGVDAGDAAGPAGRRWGGASGTRD